MPVVTEFPHNRTEFPHNRTEFPHNRCFETVSRRGFEPCRKRYYKVTKNYRIIKRQFFLFF